MRVNSDFFDSYCWIDRKYEIYGSMSIASCSFLMILSKIFKQEVGTNEKKNRERAS
jgi:hypothetical protein